MAGVIMVSLSGSQNLRYIWFKNNTRTVPESVPGEALVF